MSVDHYENFPVASWLLPKDLQRPIELIYHFARSADDFADEGSDTDMPQATRLQHLQAYQEELNRLEQGQSASTPFFTDLGQMIRERNLPLALFHDLLSAFIQDVTQTRYADYPELLDYCRRSANPIGRLLLHLFQRATPQNLIHSDAICTALQLANHWQDIGIDLEKHSGGRIYLPQTDLQRFNISETQLRQRRWTPALAALLDFQTDRTRHLMESGRPLGRALSFRQGLEIRATLEGGLRILEKIRQVRGNVFEHRPTLKPRDWFLIAWRAL